VQSFLPKKPEDVVQHFGYIEVNPAHNANLFYWMFESQQDPSTDPVILWMTGGPGCSSELALFFENGPFSVNSQEQLVPNPYSWNNFANLLFVDQPAGVGFSYADEDYVTNEAQMAQDMYTFLQGFFTKYTQYANNSFFIIGESFGGHYVPALAAKVLQQNHNSSNLMINLEGIGIGNGWVDPEVQYGSYGPFSYMNKLIDESIYSQMNQTYEQCVGFIDTQDWNDAENTCGEIMQDVINAQGDINVYNIDLPCVGPLCYDLSNITNYLNLAQVQSNLGVKPGTTWQACNDDVNSMFAVDIEQSYRFDVPLILASGVRVIVYSGMLDLICNYVGGAMWTAGMKWPGQNGFVNTPYHDWKVGSQVAGHVKSYQSFTWLEVEGAGHMVPHDQPSASLAMLKTFLNDQPF
jgi:carboxypeptidase C (cathepsin A)